MRIELLSFNIYYKKITNKHGYAVTDRLYISDIKYIIYIYQKKKTKILIDWKIKMSGT